MVNENIRNINPSKVLKAAYFRNLLNTLIPTLGKLTYFTPRVPTSQSPETDANVAIRPKKIISIILVSIPGNQEKT